MRITSLFAPGLLIALAPVAHAQGAPAAQPAGAADQLAAVMRRVTAAPTDVYALVTAGELSIKLDDMSAAAAFFARAERIDPRNGRIKAGMAAILVRAERPGEALRYFQMAERFGHAPARYAADRGLAHDLLGEQERAQRDYRLALRTTPDDETVRRYALSLGISGLKQDALRQLDPLTRRQDRAAWRVRAFVLAMTGDVAGASTIAETTMPRGMAGGLRPFFERLPSLAPADRAFAVHFGEVRPTPARLADARLRPVLPPLGPDPDAPVQVAAVRAAAPARAPRGRPRAERPPRGRVEVAAVRVPPVPAPRPVAPAPTPAPVAAPVRVAAAPVAVAPAAVAPAPAPTAVPTVDPQPVEVASAASSPIPPPVTSSSIETPPIVVAASMPAPPVVASAEVALAPPPAAAAPVATATAEVFDLAGVAPVTAPASEPVLVETATLVPSPAPVTAVRSEDSILARIVASITIPGEELGIVQPARRTATLPAASPAAARVLAAGEAKAAIQNADRTAAARTIATASGRASPATRRRPAEATDVESTARRPRDRRTELAAKGEIERGPRAVGKRKADGGKGKGKAGAAGPEEPGRIWVQIAAGASERDLPRAWTAAQRKAAALKGRAAYVAPSRRTNRVVTGPFATEAEARALVNKLSGQGVSAFSFTSTAGQKMTKLSAR